MFLRTPHILKQENWQKSWQIVVICQIRQSFFPSKVFYCTVLNDTFNFFAVFDKGKILYLGT